VKEQKGWHLIAEQQGGVQLHPVEDEDAFDSEIA
jgi:hypothetical protein